MYKILTLLLFVFILESCDKLTEIHFKNSDETSGGFLDVQLDLNADKTLTLTRIDQKVVSENEAGTSYEPELHSTSGTWTISDDELHCDFNDSSEFIVDAFFKSDFKTKGIRQNLKQIIFPISTDTIYIYGQPCIKTKTTNR
jgi:hypothetical protein